MCPSVPESSGSEPESDNGPVPPETEPGETYIPRDETASRTDAGTHSTVADTRDVSFWLGRRLGRYEVTALLGVGGMGVVYQGHDTVIERDVAIKVLPRHVSENDSLWKRFLAEARAAGKLNHPNAVGIYEIANEGETQYLVMELVPGGSVGDKLKKQGAYSVYDATRITAEACKGLSAAHAVGLVHRDIKPGNLLRTRDGSIKVADFGLAKGGPTNTEGVTQAGRVVGTPYFMSPEQCEGRAVDSRSDLYSLGATYYSLLTGSNPYESSGSVMQVMYSHCHAAPLDPRDVNRAIPEACAAIVSRATAKRPEGRYQSAEEMLADLNTVLASLSGAAIVLPSSRASQSGAPIFEHSGMLPAQRGTSRRNLLLLVGGFIALGLCGVSAAISLWSRGRPQTPENPNAAADESSTKSAAAAVVPPSGPALRVGILHSLSGTLAASESPVVDAALLAIDEINTAGGLLGRPVEPVVADGRSDANIFAAEARRLIDDEQVCTVFGCWTSSSRKTVVPIFEERNHLLVYPVQYEGLEESPNVIYTGAAPNQQILPAVQWAYAFQGKRRFFLVGSDYVFPRTANAVIKDALRELQASVVGEAYLPLGGTSFKAIVDEIVASKPDMILSTINGDSNVAFFRELRRAAVSPQEIPTISFSIGEEELRHLNPAQMAGDFAAWNYFQSIESAENQEFVARFRHRYGPQRVLTDPMEAAWFGVRLWAEAVRESGSDNPEMIRRAMLNLRMRAPEGDVRIDSTTQHTFKTPRVGRIGADGQFEVVWIAAKPEAPQPFPRSRSVAEWKAFLHDLQTGWNGQWAAPVD